MNKTNHAPPSSDQERWRVTGVRRRILQSEWEDDAEDRLADFFVKEVRDHLPMAETSRNPAASSIAQIAVVYDDPPEVTPLQPGSAPADLPEDDVALVVTPELWPQQQETCYLTVGLNDCLVRVDLEERDDGRYAACYRVVPPDTVVVIPDPKRPDRPAMVREVRERTDPRTGAEEWVWEEWDVRDPAAPVFRLLVYHRDGTEEDATERYTGATGWPEQYRRNGAPVMPYVAYHRRPGRRMWTPLPGWELFAGTLSVAALWTMWLGGVRDGAHPQRGVIDGDVVGGTQDLGDGMAPVRVMRANALSLLQIRSKSETQRASTFQWQPAMEPKTAAEAIESFEAALAQHAGISPADIHRGSASSSGYAIVVSRDGQRKAQKRLIPTFRASDQLLLATAAKLVNEANGTALPEAPSLWAIDYAELGDSPQEVETRSATVRAELAARLISRETAIRRLNPSWTDAQVAEEIARIDGTDGETTTDPEDTPDDSPDDSMAEELDAMLETLDALETAGANAEMVSDLRASVREVVSMRGAGRGR